MISPAPLVPVDCDCRGLEFMPLEVGRLVDSDLTALSTGDEFKAAVILWAKSWSQCPAGSLPDDDRILAHMVSYRLSDWMTVREMALRNWVRCSDKRLYHPVIADLAIKAAAKRKGQSDRANSRWAASKAAKSATAVPQQSETDAMAALEDATAMQVKGTVEGTVNPPTPLGDFDELFEKTFAAYPQTGRASTSREKSRPAWSIACTKETPRRLLQAAEAFSASEYATADRGKRVPSFHKWLAEARYEAWLPAVHSAHRAFPGPPDIRALVVDKKGEPYCRSYLDPCGWQDVPDRMILAANGVHADRLLRDFKAEFLDREIVIGRKVAA